jgi:hypothetical protein
VERTRFRGELRRRSPAPFHGALFRQLTAVPLVTRYHRNMPSAPRSRHHHNVDGPFYVVNGECMSCGAPEMHAPKLMSHDSKGHCFFARQPASPHETNEAIESTWASCCGALRCGGTDDGILIRLAELGLAEQCDFRLRQEPKPRARTCVSFEFAGQSKTAAASAGKLQHTLPISLGSLTAATARCARCVSRK